MGLSLGPSLVKAFLNIESINSKAGRLLVQGDHLTVLQVQYR
jgi:hypothetical protein